MSRYIDANDLEKMRSTREFYGDAVAELDWTDLCIAAADSIDLVRCAECRWSRPRTFKGETGYRCVFYRTYKAETGYCDIGEREGE